MLIMHTVESTFADVTFHGRMRLARAMRLDMGWIRITWQKREDGQGVAPRIDVVDPSTENLPAEQQATLPPLRDTLREHGVPDPDAMLKETAAWMVAQLRHRMEAFT